MNVDLYQVLTLGIGGGAGITALRLAYVHGQHRKAFDDFQKDFKDKKESDEKRFGVLERLVIYDRLPKLLGAGAVEQNSPLSVPDIAEKLKKVGGPHPALVRAFSRVMQKPLPTSDALVMASVIEAVGMEMLEERAEAWGRVMMKDGAEQFNFGDYMTFWLIAFRQAERDGDGGKNVLSRMGVDELA